MPSSLAVTLSGKHACISIVWHPKAETITMGTRPACSRTLALLFCAFSLGHVSSLGSKEFQCAKRQILNAIDLPEFLWDNCIVETDQPSLNKTDCTVWDFGEGKGYYDCSNLQFSLLSSSDSYVSGIEIYPYVERFPNFLINFRDIQWNYMQYRLQVDSSNVCHRVWFNSSGLLHQGLRVSFACDKVDHGGANIASLLEAELLVDVGISPSQITGHAHYAMKVPQSKEGVDPLNKSVSIKHWIILVAVDVSHKPDLWVYWPAIPDRHNVSEYIIRINDAEPKMVDQSSCKDGYCSHKLFAGYLARNISISVQPVHKDCFESCYSYTPNIILETCLPLYIKILAILVPILTVLFMILIVYYFCCTAPREPLKVLLLFDATTSHHCRVVRKLVDYLKDFCQVHCLIDHAEIPLTESQNPSKWLYKVIDEADSVLYVASPKPYMDIRYSEYPNVVYEALSLIEQHRKGHTDNRRGHYQVAVPPYCSKKNIPKSLMDVPRFYIPYELSWLLWSLYNQHCWMAPFTWMAKVYLQYAWCPGPMSAYRQHGTLLKEALGVANAHKITEEEKPLDESWIEGTRIGREGDTNDTATIYNYPGRLDALSLSGKLGGSLSSKSNIVAKMTIDVDTLEL